MEERFGRGYAEGAGPDRPEDREMERDREREPPRDRREPSGAYDREEGGHERGRSAMDDYRGGGGGGRGGGRGRGGYGEEEDEEQPRRRNRQEEADARQKELEKAMREVSGNREVHFFCSCAEHTVMVNMNFFM